ncbi:MAG: glycoside hydrolase family 32 protein [Clostridia bacterium]|nr:glycoside hydrolase family 32 protein [Clostridia bacterium]
MTRRIIIRSAALLLSLLLLLPLLPAVGFAAADDGSGEAKPVTGVHGLSGSWTVEGGTVRGEARGQGDTFAISDMTVGQDDLFIYEADVSSTTTNPDFNASLVFGLVNPDHPAERFYDFGIMTGSDRFIRFDQTNGAPLSGIDVGSIENKSTFHVKIVRADREAFHYYIDGKRVLERTHPDFKGGYIGMMTNDNASYENVTLTVTGQLEEEAAPHFNTQLPGITAINGTWEETPGGLRGTTWGGDTWAYFNESEIAADVDFIFEADLTVKAGNHAAGILFGVKNPASGKGYPDSLICHMIARGDGNMMLFAHKNGGPAWTEAVGLNENDRKTETYHLRLEKIGTTANGYINGTLYKTYTLPEYTGGYLGLMVSGGTTCIYDNVTYTPAEAPALGAVTVKGDGLDWTVSDGDPLYKTVDFACKSLTVSAEFDAGLSGSINGKPVKPGQTASITLGLLDNAVTVTVTDPATGLSVNRIVHVNREPDPATLYTESLRPKFHFTPYAGQMNDPNGLVYMASTGEYHLFFQCNRAFDTGVPGLSGTTSWGHAVSTDLMHWEELPLAITPDQWGMAWSGSAIIDRNNTSGLFDDTTPPESRLVCFYAAVGAGLEYGYAKECMVYSKDGGRTFIRYEGNPVVKNPDNVYGGGLRDPKVFWYADESMPEGGIWVMVCVGNLTFFTSHNLTDWRCCGRPTDVNGQVFDSECPDLFPLAVDDNPDNIKWVYTGGGLYYIIGHMEKTGEDKVMFIPETDQIVPLEGFAMLWEGCNSCETYATQTIHNEKNGRTVAISWLRDPSLFIGDKIWNSAQSTPMEYSLRTINGQVKLCMYPVSETKSLRGDPIFEASSLTIDENTPNPLADVHSTCCDIEMTFIPGTADTVTLNLREGHGQVLSVRYSRPEGKLYVDKTKCSEGSFSGVYEPTVTADADGRVTLRVLLDQSVFDVYGNGGEAAVSGLIFTNTKIDGMSLSADGSVTVESLTVWPMNAEASGETDTETEAGTDVPAAPSGADTDPTAGADDTDGPDIGTRGCRSSLTAPLAAAAAVIAAAGACLIGVLGRRKNRLF